MTNLYQNDEIVIYFKTPTDPPYRMIGKFKAEDDEYFYIIGTVGEYIDKDYIIPKADVKMIEVIQRIPEMRRKYDEAWPGEKR